MQLHKLQTYADPVLDRQLEELFRMLAKPIGSGAPTVLPRYVGDEYLDSVAGIWYKATGLTVLDWDASAPFLKTPRAINGVAFDGTAAITIPTADAAAVGSVALVGGTVVVPAAAVAAGSRIILTVQALGTVAAPKACAVTARVVGVSFTITSADATDTSTVAYALYN